MNDRKGIEVTFLYQDLNNNWGTENIIISLNDKYKNRKKLSTRQLTEMIKEKKKLKTVCIYNIVNIYE